MIFQNKKERIFRIKFRSDFCVLENKVGLKNKYRYDFWFWKIKEI